MKTAHYIFFGILSLSALSLPAGAQEKETIQRNLVLEKEYDPQVETAGKIFTMPQVESFKPQKADIVFSTSENLLRLTGDVTTLSAAEAQLLLPDALQKGYFRLGGGNHLHFTGDGHLNLVNDEKHFLGLSLNHRSENRPGEKTSWDNDNFICLQYGLGGRNVVFDASLSEEFYNFHYDPAFSPATAEASGSMLQMPSSQWFSDTKLHLQAASRPGEKRVDFAISLDESFFRLHRLQGFDNMLSEGPMELETRVKASVSGKLNEEWRIGVGFQLRNFQVWNRPAPEISVSAQAGVGRPRPGTWFEVLPKVDYRWNLWSFTGGVHLSRMSGSDYNFRIAPELTASTPLGNKALLKLHVNGGERAFSYGDGFRQNLYIDPNLRLKPEYIPLHLAARLDWRPVEMFSITPYAGFRFLRDMAVFNNGNNLDPDGFIPVFQALYVNANHLYMGLDATFDWCEKVSFEGGFRYNVWNAADLAKVWYKPAMEADARIDVKAIRNLLLSVSYQLQADRYVKCGRMDDIHLLNAEISYRFSRFFGVFVEGWNLLNRQDARWYSYENNGITLTGGIFLSF